MSEQKNKLLEKQKSISSTLDRLDYKISLDDEIIEEEFLTYFREIL